MLFIKVKGKERAILFQHHKKEVKTTENTQLHPYKTVCRIFEDKEKCIGEGQSVVAPVDNFEYERGRVLAFTRALKACGLTKEERAQAWKQYHNRNK